MDNNNKIFNELPVGTKFHLFSDSKLTYMKTGEKKAQIVHKKEKFYIQLSEQEVVYVVP